MATDVAVIDRHLRDFYDFTDKRIISIGAGGGGLLEYARHARFVVAVDHGEAALDRLITRVRQDGLASRFFMFRGDIRSVHFTGDVVLFEFSLHEMPACHRSLQHASCLARHIVVMDHAPGSPWSWLAGEENGVDQCWAAVRSAGVVRQEDVEASQSFDDFAEVKRRFARRGPTSQERIAELAGATSIVIPMPYRLALLDSTTAAFDLRWSPLEQAVTRALEAFWSDSHHGTETACSRTRAGMPPRNGCGSRTRASTPAW